MMASTLPRGKTTIPQGDAGFRSGSSQVEPVIIRPAPLSAVRSTSATVDGPPRLSVFPFIHRTHSQNLCACSRIRTRRLFFGRCNFGPRVLFTTGTDVEKEMLWEELKGQTLNSLRFPMFLSWNSISVSFERLPLEVEIDPRRGWELEWPIGDQTPCLPAFRPNHRPS